MSHRFATESTLLVIAFILLMSLSVAGQKWSPARTPDGQPDLQGIWTNATITPFERPAEFADKPFLTEKEAAELESRAAQGRVDAAPRPGDPGNYNQFWFDSGTKVVKSRRTSLVVDPPDGKVPVRPEAEAKRDYNAAHVADSYEHMSIWDRCITRGIPGGMFPAGYNNAYQIIQGPGYVVIFYEMIHESRLIPLDGRPHLPSSVRLWNGDSRGHWEGDTLVVDTTNYNNKGWIATNASSGRIKGILQSEALHVVERFTRIDAVTIKYEVTIDDPNIYTRPWKVEIPLNRDPDYQIFEYACQEGNHAVENILNGGRAAEKTGEQGSKGIEVKMRPTRILQDWLKKSFLRPQRRRSEFLVAASTIAILSLTLASQTPRSNQVTLFEGARLIAGDGKAAIENSAFIVENNRFARVGKKGELQLPAGGARVDLAGKTVIPAMVDVHSHLGFLNQKNGSMSKENFNRENLLDHLNRYAYHGFAAAISMGTDMGDLPYQLREEVHPGAALFRTVGRGLAWPGSGPNDPSRNDVPYVVTTVEQARRAVQELAPHRPDFVKIWVDDRNDTQKKLTPELYGAAIDEARKLGLRAVAHVYELGDAKGLVRAGIEGFTHLVRDKDIDNEFIALLKQHPSVFFTPNLGITSRAMDAGRPAWLDDPLLHETIPPGEIKRLENQFANRKSEALVATRASWDLQVRNLAKLRAAGVRIVLGSDSAGDPSRTMGWHAIWELDALAKAGMTPSEVIVASTRLAAETLKLDQLGMVAPGKSADFVVLNANPLENIANTRKIDRVYLRGQEVDRAALRRSWTGR